MTLHISGMRRPKRSAISPNKMAPTGRIASVAVIVRTMSFFGTPKCCASVSIKNTTTKKSKASIVQPRNPARTAGRAPGCIFVFAESVFVGSVIGEWRLMRNRCARRPSGEDSIDELSVFENQRSVHKHKLNALRVLQRIIEGSFIDDPLRGKNGDVRIGPNANATLILKYWCPLFEPLRGQ